MNARIAAFFDLDGTLMPLPSVERRFFRALRYRGEIPLTNYFFWGREALKLLPRGGTHVMHGNKMYLRSVRSFAEISAGNRIDSPAHKSSQGSHPRWLAPHFLEDGVARVAWHAMQGHAIVIVSGTLEPLAKAAAQILETELASRGIGAEIRVCATRLEECDGMWTGRILGEPMFGDAKARAILPLAEEMGLDLSRSWAYGDSAQDRSMLAAVGNPVAVNPSARLARIARKHRWPLLRWRTEKDLTQSSQRAQRRESGKKEIFRNECALQDVERWA